MALYIGTEGRSGWHCHADSVALSIGRSGSQPPEYSFVLGKIKRLVIPFYCWLLIYGLISNIFLDFGILTYGEKLSINNYFIYPLSVGCRYCFTAAWWLVPVLFVGQVINVILRRLLRIGDSYLRDILLLFVYIIVGAFSVEYSNKVGGQYGGQMPLWLVIVVKAGFLLPFFHSGHLLKERWGKVVDSCNSIIFYGIIFLCKLLISGC